MQYISKVLISSKSIPSNETWVQQEECTRALQFASSFLQQKNLFYYVEELTIISTK